MDVDVLVVGSVNRDWRLEVPSLPRPGETVLGTGASLSSGGKGANQAVAASQAGATVSLIGAVGDDPQGAELRSELSRSGVNVTELRTVVGVPSGMAFVAVDQDSENLIIVNPGANAFVTLDPIRSDVKAAVVLTQAEIPPQTITAAAEFAHNQGAHFIFNAAPAPASIAHIPRGADPLIVNQHEMAALLDAKPSTAGIDAERLRCLAGAHSLIVTLGAAGCLVCTDAVNVEVPGIPVDEVIDSTGAGDWFVGTLSAHLALGMGLADAARLATAAGAQAVGWIGARPPWLDTTGELSTPQH